MNKGADGCHGPGRSLPFVDLRVFGPLDGVFGAEAGRGAGSQALLPEDEAGLFEKGGVGGLGRVGRLHGDALVFGNGRGVNHLQLNGCFAAVLHAEGAAGFALALAAHETGGAASVLRRFGLDADLLVRPE